MATDSANQFWQWLVERQARINDQLKSADDSHRMLIKTDRAELETIMVNYKRMVIEAPEGPTFPTTESNHIEGTGDSSGLSSCGFDESLAFRLTRSAEDAIALGIRVIRLILSNAHSTPHNIKSVANALYALQRMPLSTPGVCSTFNIDLRAGDEEFREFRYIGFGITEDAFAITRGGSTYSKSDGSDSYSEDGWRLEAGEEGRVEGNLDEIQHEIDEFIALGATFSVSDESEVEFE
jgi:hypothetical protein